MIEIYTDGAARGNPGPGGYGVVMKYKNHRKEISEGFIRTTNNRMELMAVIAALEALKKKPSSGVIYTDSRYISEAVNKGWVFQWERKQFKKKKNIDLWKRFLTIYRQHDFKLVWIKGHDQIPENERCDQLAVEASKKPNLKKDTGLEEENRLF